MKVNKKPLQRRIDQLQELVFWEKFQFSASKNQHLRLLLLTAAARTRGQKAKVLLTTLATS